MPSGKGNGFVLVALEIGREKEALEKISKYDGVRKVYSPYGLYSAVVEVDLNHRDVVHQIRETDCVYSVTLFPCK